MTHTPGPWHIDNRAWAARGVVVEIRSNSEPPAQLIAQVSAATGAHRMPNARLIAAAPDMLAALQAAWSRLTGDGIARDLSPIEREVADNIRTAIAKATS